MLRNVEATLRWRPLDVVLAAGIATVVISEGLSLGHWLTRPAVWACWVFLTAAAVAFRKRIDLRPRRMPAPVLAILAVTLAIALVSPPNGWDALSYHLSRVGYWIQDRSLEHFPTHDVRQVVFSPFSEMCVLQLQLLSGGDHFANLVQWVGFAGSLCAVAELVGRFGGSARAAEAALLFAATLPIAIVQATSVENDLLVALWLLVLLCSVEESLRTGTLRAALQTGAAAGLLALTKGTGYVLGAPVLIGWTALLLWRSREESRRRAAIVAIGCAGLLALALNAGHYARNLAVFGRPLGDGQFIRYHQNELHAPRVLASNLIRNAAFHLGTPSATINAAVVRGVRFAHGLLGIRANDPRTTFLASPFSVRMSTHEDLSNAPLHFVAVALLLAAFAGRRLSLPRGAAACAAIAAAGYVGLAWSLKWQIWGSRFQAPLFLVMAVPCGVAAAKVLGDRAYKWISAAFVVGSLPWLLANETRPLITASVDQPARNLITRPRAELYVADWPLDEMLRATGVPTRGWDLQASYEGAVEALERVGCHDVGLVQGIDSWDYPLWALAHARGFELRIRQIRVGNETGRVPSSRRGMCAVVSIDSFMSLGPPNGDDRSQGTEIYARPPITISLTRRPTG